MSKDSTPREDARASILSLLAPHKRSLVFAFLCIVGESAADVAQPWPLKIVIDNVIGHKQSHGWLFKVIRHTVGLDAHNILLFACGAVGLIAIVDALCSYGDKYLTTSVGQWVTHDLRRSLYAHVQRLSMSYHDHSKTGDLISRVTSDIDAVQTFIVQGLLGILVNILTLLFMIAVMFHMNWRFTLVALAVVPVLFAIVYNYTRRAKKLSREVRQHEGKMLSVVQEVLGSMRVVKAFAREDYEVHRLEGESLETVEASLRARAMKARLVPMVDIVVAAGTCAVLYFGASFALEGGLSPGSMVVFLTYIGKMYKPMQELSKTMDTFTKADIGYERIQEVIGSADDMRDAPNAKNAPELHGFIDVEEVSFSYSEDRPVLHSVSMHVEPGHTVALVGPTGSGKSTLVNLIARFYDPNDGVVKIDGCDVRNWKQKSLRSQISFVLQDTVLFSGTIWENIAYGRPEATKEEIIAAAEAANAAEFIDKLPQKYATTVGERGVMLSGGQRQRIAIARAIVRNSPILILDEPTAALDSQSEHLVFEALDRLMQNKTAIVIAHRLSTVRNANCIYVLKDGHIMESGSHDDLMVREHGIYRQLYDIQFHSSEAEPALLA